MGVDVVKLSHVRRLAPNHLFPPKKVAAAYPNSRVTPRAVPLPFAPWVAHADHVQLLRLEEGQQAVAQTDLPHVCHCIGVALHQSTGQAGLHVSR